MAREIERNVVGERKETFHTRRQKNMEKLGKAFINMHSGGTISYKTDVKNYLFRRIRRLCIVYMGGSVHQQTFLFEYLSV